VSLTPGIRAFARDRPGRGVARAVDDPV